MKRLNQLILALVLLAGSFVPSAYAQRVNEDHPGFVDLEKIGDLEDFFDTVASMEITVEGPMMRLVAEASRIEDPELADLLLKLEGVYVLSFPLTSKDLEDFDARASRMGRDLEREGWTVVVKYRDDEENVRMYAKLDGDSVAGMIVMSVEEGASESVFINIVGEIDPAQIGRIGQKFNLRGITDL